MYLARVSNVVSWTRFQHVIGKSQEYAQLSFLIIWFRFLNYVKCFINGRNKYKFDDTTYMSKQEMRARAQSNRLLYPHILVVADFDTISLLGEKKAKKNK